MENQMQALSARQSFESEGYVCLRGFLSQTLIQTTLNELDTLLSQQYGNYFSGPFPGRDEAVIRLFARNRHYRRHLYQWINESLLTPYQFPILPQIKTLCTQLGIEQPIFQMARMRFHLPNEDFFQTGTHQDIGIMESENSISFWLPLIPAEKSNGVIQLYAQSHQEGVLVPKGPDYRGHSFIDPDVLKKYPQVLDTYHPGDLIAFHTKLIHTSTPNRSRNCRWAVLFRFNDGADNQYFDLETNPLHAGYIMKKTQGSTSGFSEGKAQSTETSNQQKAQENYARLKTSESL